MRQGVRCGKIAVEIEIRTGLANSSDFLRSARINMIQAGAASRIAEMEAMKRNIAAACIKAKTASGGYVPAEDTI